MPLYRMTPFMIVLSVYRRVFMGVWFSASRIMLHPFHGEHIRVYKRLPAELEADVVKHEVNHADIAIEDVADNCHWAKWSAPAALASFFLIIGIAPQTGPLMWIVFGSALFSLLWGLHREKSAMEDAANENIDWEQYNLWRDYSEPVKAVLKIIDNWLHTITGIFDGILLFWSSCPKIAVNGIKNHLSAEDSVLSASAQSEGDT